MDRPRDLWQGCTATEPRRFSHDPPRGNSKGITTNKTTDQEKIFHSENESSTVHACVMRRRHLPRLHLQVRPIDSGWGVSVVTVNVGTTPTKAPLKGGYGRVFGCLFACSPSLRRVPVVLDRVVRSPGQHLRDFCPLVAMDAVSSHEDFFLCASPRILLDRRVQLIMPPEDKHGAHRSLPLYVAGPNCTIKGRG